MLLVVGISVGLILGLRQHPKDHPSAPLPPGSVASTLVATNHAPICEEVTEPPSPPGLAFTDWMTVEEFSAHLKANDSTGFWKENWISAAEGRIVNGVRQYRTVEEPRPRGVAYWWYWWYDMDEAFYQERLADLREKGFDHVYHQIYVGEDGRVRHQGVWHKVEP